MAKTPEKIRTERHADQEAVRDLYRQTFPDQLRVIDLVDALRKRVQTFEPKSFVAVVKGQVVGHVMCTWSLLDAPYALASVSVLSPLAVLPDFQRQGIATRLIDHAREAAADMGSPLLFVEGDPDFYGKRGFQRASDFGFRAPSSRIPDAAFQVTRLAAYQDWMTGALVYSQTFWDFDCVGLRGEELARVEQTLSNG